MLFTGLIAVLIGRFHDFQAQRSRSRRMPSARSRSDRDKDGPAARNC